jgi:hypothetical protein
MIKSFLNMNKKPVTPEFEPGEELLRMFSASLDVGRSALSSWRLCNLYLTNKRLITGQARKVIRDFRFDQVERVTVVERPWIASKKIPQIEIVMKSGKIYFIAVRDATSWLTQMAEVAGWDLDDSRARPWKEKRPTVRLTRDD